MYACTQASMHTHTLARMYVPPPSTALQDAEAKLLEFFKLMREYVPGEDCLAGMPVPSKLGLEVQSFM